MFGFKRDKKQKKQKKTDDSGIAELKALAGENFIMYRACTIFLIIGFLAIGFAIIFPTDNFWTNPFLIVGIIIIIIALVILGILLSSQVRKNKANHVYDNGINNRDFYNHLRELRGEEVEVVKPKFIAKATDFSLPKEEKDDNKSDKKTDKDDIKKLD